MVGEGAAEGAVGVSVTDPVKHGEGVNAYMSYKVVSKGREGELEKSSLRRFSDFEWLHTRLCSTHRGIIVPPLPDKNVVEKFRFSKEFIEVRRRALEKFIVRTAQHPILKESPELTHFLEDDEETWSRQTTVPADTRGGVFGKKPSEYISMFKEMQWSLSSMVMGHSPSLSSSSSSLPPPLGPHPGAGTGAGAGAGGRGGTGSGESGGWGGALGCNEEESDRLKHYAEEVERIFVDAHKQSVMFLKKQRETAVSLRMLGAALAALGQAEGAAGMVKAYPGKREDPEGGGEGPREKEGQALLMGQAFVDVAQRCEAASALMTNQSSAYMEQVEEALKEYSRLAHSLKRVLNEQSAAVREERHLEADLHMKKTRLEKLNATMGTVDRLRELEAEVSEAHNKAVAASSQREELTRAMYADMQRFHNTMLADVGGILSSLRHLHSDLAQRSFRCWNEGLPLLRQARSSLHHHQQQQQQQQQQQHRGEGKSPQPSGEAPTEGAGEGAGTN